MLSQSQWNKKILGHSCIWQVWIRTLRQKFSFSSFILPEEKLIPSARIQTTSIKGIKLHGEDRIWSFSLAYMMQLHQRLSSDMAGLLRLGFSPPAFHFTSAQEDTVVAMCLPSRYCIVKYSLISRRESQRSLLQPSCVSSLIKTCIEANFLEYTQI